MIPSEVVPSWSFLKVTLRFGFAFAVFDRDRAELSLLPPPAPLVSAIKLHDRTCAGREASLDSRSGLSFTRCHCACHRMRTVCEYRA